MKKKQKEINHMKIRKIASAFSLILLTATLSSAQDWQEQQRQDRDRYERQQEEYRLRELERRQIEQQGYNRMLEQQRQEQRRDTFGGPREPTGGRGAFGGPLR